MEKINLNYSLKNIPTPDKNAYELLLIDKIEAVVRRMRWKLHWANNEDERETSENFGFKSRKTPPVQRELENFETDLFNIATKLKYRKFNDPFQSKMHQDIKKIENSGKMYVFADKTSNIYTMSVEKHDELLDDNVTKSYEIAPKDLEKSINLEGKDIAKSYGIDERVECIANAPAFITLKDHKENFQQKQPCRLLNPCKSEIGAVSKRILDRINSAIREKTQVNQWKNSDTVIEWFKNIKHKQSCFFVQMDIKEFYPSISEKILDKALNFAKSHTQITNKEIETIKHCRKSLLFIKETAWKKTNTQTSFDVTMGSFDGAEICELIGLYILDKLSKRLGKNNVGLYRDDGLGIYRTKSGRLKEKLRQDIINIFQECGFQIEIALGMFEVNFLDVTFNLQTGTYRPYKKPNDTLMYINTSSNHPRQIINQLPTSINERLSKNSSNETVFNESKIEYIEALKRSGYKNPTLTYKNSQQSQPRRNRRRNIIWFNPPFNKNVSTNIAKIFLKLIDQHFSKDKTLHKLFNRNNVKVSYSCTPNIGRIIKSHNKKLSTTKQEQEPCNCRTKNECPLKGDCKKTSVIYKCDISAQDTPKKTYIGLTEREIKTRISEHKATSKSERYSNSTTLSAYVWELRCSGKSPTLEWSIIKEIKSYNNISKSCNLCLYEKYAILNYPSQEELLNKRSELVSKCRHQNKYLLANYKSKKD